MAFAYSIAAIAATKVSKIGYPMWEFLTGQSDRFRDFYVQLSNTHRIEIIDFESLVRVVRGVFPLAILLYGHLGGVAGLTVRQSLLVYNLLVVLVLITGILCSFRKWFVRLFVITSFPVLFAFFRGNNELLTFGVFLCGVAVARRSLEKGVLIASLGQLIEPHLSFLFVVKLITKRTMLLKILVLSAAVVLLASLYVPESSMFMIIRSIFEFSATQGQGGTLFRLTHNVSLIAGIEGYAYLIRGTSGMPPTSLSVALVGSTVILVSALIVFLSAQKSKVNDVDLLIVLMSISLLVPVYSFSYRTIWLLFPLGLILESPIGWTTSRLYQIQMYILIGLVLPKSWLVWSDPVSGLYFYESTLIDPVLTLVLLIVTLTRIHHGNKDGKTANSHLKISLN